MAAKMSIEALYAGLIEARGARVPTYPFPVFYEPEKGKTTRRAGKVGNDVDKGLPVVQERFLRCLFMKFSDTYWYWEEERYRQMKANIETLFTLEYLKDVTVLIHRLNEDPKELYKKVYKKGFITTDSKDDNLVPPTSVNPETLITGTARLSDIVASFIFGVLQNKVLWNDSGNEVKNFFYELVKCCKYLVFFLRVDASVWVDVPIEVKESDITERDSMTTVREIRLVARETDEIITYIFPSISLFVAIFHAVSKYPTKMELSTLLTTVREQLKDSAVFLRLFQLFIKEKVNVYDKPEILFKGWLPEGLEGFEKFYTYRDDMYEPGSPAMLVARNQVEDLLDDAGLKELKPSPYIANKAEEEKMRSFLLFLSGKNEMFYGDVKARINDFAKTLREGTYIRKTVSTTPSRTRREKAVTYIDALNAGYEDVYSFLEKTETPRTQLREYLNVTESPPDTEESEQASESVQYATPGKSGSGSKKPAFSTGAPTRRLSMTTPSRVSFFNDKEINDAVKQYIESHPMDIKKHLRSLFVSDVGKNDPNDKSLSDMKESLVDAIGKYLERDTEGKFLNAIKKAFLDEEVSKSFILGLLKHGDFIKKMLDILLSSDAWKAAVNAALQKIDITAALEARIKALEDRQTELTKEQEDRILARLVERFRTDPSVTVGTAPPPTEVVAPPRTLPSSSIDSSVDVIKNLQQELKKLQEEVEDFRYNPPPLAQSDLEKLYNAIYFDLYDQLVNVVYSLKPEFKEEDVKEALKKVLREVNVDSHDPGFGTVIKVFREFETMMRQQDEHILTLDRIRTRVRAQMFQRNASSNAHMFFNTYEHFLVEIRTALPSVAPFCGPFLKKLEDTLNTSPFLKLHETGKELELYRVWLDIKKDYQGSILYVKYAQMQLASDVFTLVNSKVRELEDTTFKFLSDKYRQVVESVIKKLAKELKKDQSISTRALSELVTNLMSTSVNKAFKGLEAELKDAKRRMSLQRDLPDPNEPQAY